MADFSDWQVRHWPDQSLLNFLQDSFPQRFGVNMVRKDVQLDCLAEMFGLDKLLVMLETDPVHVDLIKICTKNSLFYAVNGDDVAGRWRLVDLGFEGNAKELCSSTEDRLHHKEWLAFRTN